MFPLYYTEQHDVKDRSFYVFVRANAIRFLKNFSILYFLFGHFTALSVERKDITLRLLQNTV